MVAQGGMPFFHKHLHLILMDHSLIQYFFMQQYLTDERVSVKTQIFD